MNSNTPNKPQRRHGLTASPTPSVNRGPPTLRLRIPRCPVGSAGTSSFPLSPRASEERSGQSFLPAGLCVDVSLPISLPLRFSIPVAVDGGGLGLCVELVLPIPSPEDEPATPFSPADGAPPVSAARETMLEPMKMAKAAAAVPILRRIKRSLLDFANASTCLLRGNARAWARFALGLNLTCRARCHNGRTALHRSST